MDFTKDFYIVVNTQEENKKAQQFMFSKGYPWGDQGTAFYPIALPAILVARNDNGTQKRLRYTSGEYLSDYIGDASTPRFYMFNTVNLKHLKRKVAQ